MAQLGAANVIQLYQRGDADMVGLFGLRDVSAGDTVDLSTVAAEPAFQSVKRAAVIATTDFVEIAANIAGTVVTMPAGLAVSAGYLTVWGC